MLKQCAGALVLSGTEILLGKRAAALEFYPDVWDVFGGHVEPGEHPEQTLARELQEELGIHPTRMRPLLAAQAEPATPAIYDANSSSLTEWWGTFGTGHL